MNYAKMSRPFREIEYNEYYGVRSKEWIDIDWGLRGMEYWIKCIEKDCKKKYIVQYRLDTVHMGESDRLCILEEINKRQ